MWGSIFTGFILSSLMLLVFSDLYIDSPESVFILDQQKLGISFIILGVGCAIFTFRDYLMSRKMMWSYTIGRVVSVDTTTSFWGQRIFIVSYSYMVDDRPHINNMFDFTSKEVSLSRLKYHKGIKPFSSVDELKDEMIKVYYNPKKPWESAISRHGKVSAMVRLLPSLALLSYCTYKFSLAMGIF